MNKYYILQLDPQAAHEWDRCVLRNPMTGARPDLNEEVAKAIDGQAGSYLIKVNLQIEVLEQNLTSPCKTVELPQGNKLPTAVQSRMAS